MKSKNWSWSCFVPGAPVPQSRVVPGRWDRLGRWHKAHYPKLSAGYRNELRLALQSARPQTSFAVAFPVRCTITAFIGRPKGRNGQTTQAGKAAYPVAQRFGDSSNYAKQVEDALVDARILQNDSYVADLHSRKRWADDLCDRVSVAACTGIEIKLEAL